MKRKEVEGGGGVGGGEQGYRSMGKGRGRRE